MNALLAWARATIESHDAGLEVDDSELEMATAVLDHQFDLASGTQGRFEDGRISRVRELGGSRP